MNASRSRRDVTSETSIFNALKTKIIPHCHSERSEESLIASATNVHGIRQRWFAPLNMRLNYRLQAFMEGKYTPAFAPRLSLVLPTGDSDKGFGTGVMGYEFNLPFSKIVSDRWTLHFNAGMSVFPNAHQSHHLTNYNVGASAIYAVSRNFNLMAYRAPRCEMNPSGTR